MITLIRTAAIAPGGLAAGMKFAVEIAAYLKQTHGLDIRVVTPVGGNPFSLAWMTNYASLGEMEAKRNAMNADAKYIETIEQHANHYIAGSFHDQVLKAV